MQPDFNVRDGVVQTLCFGNSTMAIDSSQNQPTELERFEVSSGPPEPAVGLRAALDALAAGPPRRVLVHVPPVRARRRARPEEHGAVEPARRGGPGGDAAGPGAAPRDARRSSVRQIAPKAARTAGRRRAAHMPAQWPAPWCGRMPGGGTRDARRDVDVPARELRPTRPRRGASGRRPRSPRRRGRGPCPGPRASPRACRGWPRTPRAPPLPGRRRSRARRGTRRPGPVSYTHLTLPTILLV